MKKIFYILLVVTAMGFTVASSSPSVEKKADHRKKAISCSAGYIEVSGPAGYTITTRQ